MDKSKTPERVWLHDNYLNYSEADVNGVDYLRDRLSEEESKVFFDQAYDRGEADFKDNQGNRFSILYESGEYVLQRR